MVYIYMLHVSPSLKLAASPVNKSKTCLIFSSYSYKRQFKTPLHKTPQYMVCGILLVTTPSMMTWGACSIFARPLYQVGQYPFSFFGCCIDTQYFEINQLSIAVNDAVTDVILIDFIEAVLARMTSISRNESRIQKSPILKGRAIGLNTVSF
jgi:hypothetical protein